MLSMSWAIEYSLTHKSIAVIFWTVGKPQRNIFRDTCRISWFMPSIMRKKNPTCFHEMYGHWKKRNPYPLLHRILTLLSVRLGYRLSIIGRLCMKPLILRPSTVMRVKMTAKKSVLPLTIWNTQRSGKY